MGLVAVDPIRNAHVDAVLLQRKREGVEYFGCLHLATDTRLL